ncbi:MAG: adenylosuccinate lyase [Cytophagales bacterium]|nr:MAG: adenylosuccinate lyase [Cytophagales bacterium]
MRHLLAISPIDGRYHHITEPLQQYFSEWALIKYRVQVEIEYFIALRQIPLSNLETLDTSCFEPLRNLYLQFSEADALRIKEIEKTTNHDVKAVEYFIKEKFEALGISAYQEFIHFGLTSQDINNTAIPLSLKDYLQQHYYPKLQQLINSLQEKATAWIDVPMLAHTHGQPASPTRLGKEILVFVERLQNQLDVLVKIPLTAKFGGATGNFNAHAVAYPHLPWIGLANEWLQQWGLQRQQHTTQIEHYDMLAALLDNAKRINTILIDFARDVWQYIAMNYFKQKINAQEVGSSAMPHKVNPIDFENAEGNLAVANALLEFLAAKLPISRLQRDLTDSTVLRNIGVPFAHIHIALASLNKGLGKIELNPNALQKDLEQNWAVVAEAIQTILRREGYPQPYEALKALTRTGEAITQTTITQFIGTLAVSEAIKAELYAITPYNYIGIL